MNLNRKNINCRLCKNQATFSFEKLVLKKYNVSYFKCVHCKSLQTEDPYWLDEAYKFNLSNLDTGAIQRNLNNFAFCFAFIDIFNVKNVIDFGGSDGILCRFLRDHMINCKTYDKYATPVYAQDFITRDIEKVDLVMAFEVFEHLKNPDIELDEIFKFDPEYLLFSTEIFINQNDQWPYLAEQGGQHIFFYSVDAINLIAERYNYNATLIGSIILFYKKNENYQTLVPMAKKMLTGWVFNAIKPHILSMDAPGVAADMFNIKRS